MIRTPLKRKTPLKSKGRKPVPPDEIEVIQTVKHQNRLRRNTSKRKAKRTALRSKCDREWSAIIRLAGKCAVCNSTNQLQAHHLISKRVLAYRHDLNNGICLCADHHEFNLACSPHASPLAFYEWLKENRPQQFAWWDANHHKLRFGEQPDYEQVYADLKKISDSFGDGE